MKKHFLFPVIGLFMYTCIAGQPKFMLRILDPSIEITKLEPAQPVEGEMQKIFFTFTNWGFKTIALGTIGGSFEGARRDPANTSVTVTNLAYKGTLSDVIILKTPLAGESSKITLYYYEGENVRKMGYRKRMIVRTEIDIEITPVFVTKRISGISFFSWQKRDSKDSYGESNGFLTVYHNPGCGVVGNDGTDRFFVNKALPPECTILRKEYTQYWPVQRECDDPWSWANDGGSYNSVWNQNYFTVRWHNSCTGAYRSKNIIYTVSFIISMPRGMDIGETLFDVGVASPSSPPGYSRAEAPKPAYCSEYRNIGYGTAPWPVIDGPFHMPQTLVEKKPFSISYNIINAGNADMPSSDVTLFIDNASESTKTVKLLKPNESTIITWDITKELVGFSHSFELKASNGGSLSFALIVFQKAPDPK